MVLSCRIKKFSPTQLSTPFRNDQIGKGFNPFPLQGPGIVEEFEENIIVCVILVRLLGIVLSKFQSIAKSNGDKHWLLQWSSGIFCKAVWCYPLKKTQHQPLSSVIDTAWSNWKASEFGSAKA